MEYQWYPGHMTRARRMMEENCKLVDLVIELADARLPASSRNPDIDRLCAGKSRILILNKADLADPERTEFYRRQEEQRGIPVLSMDARKRAGVSMDARKRAGVSGLKASVIGACQSKIERDRKRGILNRPLRAMIVGIPNVGKSTLINSLVGKTSAKTGNKPGVTRGKQWITLNGNGRVIQLLDTPGILWPKFEDPKVGIRLALTGAVNDDILDHEELACWLLTYLRSRYPVVISERYGIAVEEQNAADLAEQDRAAEMLAAIGRRRGILKKGSEVDMARTASLLLDDFRSGRLGRISLE